MILAVITCIRVFEVADYESSITFWKFKMADPVWRPGRKKNSQNSMILAVITYIGFFEVTDYESSIGFWKFEMADPIWQPDREKNS